MSRRLVGLVAATAVAAAAATAGAGMIHTAAPADPAIALVAPARAEVGKAFRVDVVVRDVNDLAGFELVARVDRAAASVDVAGGAVARLSRAGRVFRDMSIGELDGRAVLAGYSCGPSCGGERGGIDGDVTLGSVYVEPTRPGLLEIAVRGAGIVDADGRPLAVDGSTWVATVEVGRSRSPLPAPAPPDARPEPRADAPADGGEASSSATASDVTNLELDWRRARVGGDVCGDPCIGVGQLVRLAAYARPDPEPVTSAEGATFAEPARAAFVVDTVSDDWDTNIGNGICRTQLNACSLRAAMQETNALAGADTIQFAIPGAGPHTIQLLRRLPNMSDTSGGVLIDGYTQPGAVPNDDPIASNAVIQIGIRGNGATDFDAFTVTSGANTFRGLAVYAAKRPFWIYGAAAAANRIVGSFVGTDPTGTYVSPTVVDAAHGINPEQDAPGTVIGGPLREDRNVISGNARHGIGFWHMGTDGSVVQNNIIGLSPDGARRLPNRKHGVDMNYGVSDTLVGGSGPGERNVISGNEDTAVEISHTSDTRQNQVIGNYIGTDLTGASAAPYTANSNTGVYIEDGSVASVVDGNVIVNNGKGGVQIVNGGGNGISAVNVVRSNRIGMTAAGVLAPNGIAGVSVEGSDTLVADNMIAGNSGPGIRSTELDAQRNRFTGNAIHSNSGLGIDLAPLNIVNANDDGDGDHGPNGLLNHPVLTRATDRVFVGTACAGCVVEIFRATAPTGNGSGRELVTTVTANGSGGFSIANAVVAVGDPITATAIDPSGATSEFSANVVVIEHNDPPVIDAGPPADVAEGASVTLTATGTDPDGDAFSYAWDLDGNGTFESPGASVSYSAAALDGPSTKTVAVQATDVRGAVGSDSVTVAVTNAAPTASLVAPTPVAEGGAPLVQLSDRTDPSAADVAAGLRYAFSCTGASLAGTTWATASDVPAISCPADDGPSSLNVRARIIDRDDDATEYVALISVDNVVPNVSITGAPTSVNEGSTVDLGSTTSDPSAADAGAGFTREWAMATGGATVATGSGPTFTAAPVDNGVHTITFSATDKDAGVGAVSVDVNIANVSPTASFVTAAEGSSATLSLEAPVEPSTADLAAGLRYAFSCTGESLGSVTYATASTESTRSCVYSDGLSSHPVRARILDKDGGFTDYSTSVAHGANQPPVVTTSSTATVAEGGATVLSASASDPENGPITYEWDLDDDGAFEATGQSVPFSAAALDGPVDRLVHVRAIDAEGLTATADATVSVTNVAPTGTFSNVAASEGSPVEVTVSAASDPSTADQATLRYAFSCDGSSLSGIRYASAQPTPSTTCTYPDGPASATVRARLLDDDGATTDYSATVAISNVPPTIAISSPSSVVEGATVPFDATVSDPSPADAAAGLGTTWTVVRETTTVASGGGSTGSFLAADDGTYSITFVATDKDGGSTSRTAVVVASGAAPTATIDAPTTVTEGSAVTVGLVGASDVSPADQGAGLRYAFACDGAPLDSVTYAASSTSSSVTCIFPNGPSTTVVRGRVLDKDGLFTERTASVAVVNVAPTARLAVPTDVAAGEAVDLRFDDVRDPAAADMAAGVEFAFDCGAGFGPFGADSAVSCPGAPTSVSGRVRDVDGGTTTYHATVVVHPNRLQNGSFESDANGDGKPDSWSWATKLAWSTSARTGSRSVAMTSSGYATAQLAQTVSGLVRSRYRASAWISAPVGPGTTSVTLRIKWLDGNGSVISTKARPAFTDRTSGWVVLEVDGMAPQGAVGARVEVVMATSDNGVVRVDDVALHFANQLENASFEDDTNADGRPDVWASVSRFTRSPVEVRSGAVSARGLGDGSTFTASQRITKLVTGATYRASTWFNMASTTDTYTLRFRLRWLDSQQHLVRLDTLVQATDPTAGWVQLVGGAVAPAGASEVRLELNFAGLDTAAYVDDAFVGPA